jgi:Domain of unknown function (DUF4124)
VSSLRVPLIVAAVLLPCVLAMAATQPGGSARKVYKWTDEKGQVHYGDQVPAQYSNQERHVMNAQGIEVDKLDAQKSAEQIAAEEKRIRESNAQRDRDRNLLNTYVSVQEIERLRDNRLSLVSDQIKVTNQFLDQLNIRLRKLQSDSMRFKPYNTDANAAPQPAGLVDDLVRTGNDIRTQKMNLQQKRGEEKTMRDEFTSDIERFKILKGVH